MKPSGFFVFALAALLGFSGCKKPQAVAVIEANASELKLTNGHLVRIGQTNYFTGLMVERYAGGALKSRSSISNGVMSGTSEGWFTNGVLQVREEFRAGVSEGVRTKWDLNAAKVSEATIAGGKLNGPFRRWHPNGVLAEEVEMKNDKPEGRARAWYPSGALKTEMRMAAGKVVEQKQWNDGEAPAQTVASAPSR